MNSCCTLKSCGCPLQFRIVVETLGAPYPSLNGVKPPNCMEVKLMSAIGFELSPNSKNDLSAAVRSNKIPILPETVHHSVQHIKYFWQKKLFSSY